MTEPPLVAPGTELAAGYRVIEHLNRGNRLDVYDAWSDERQSRCVLKTLRSDRAGEQPARRALVREGRLLLRFTHPHLVRAYDLTQALDDGRPVLVLETLGGETLSHLVHRLDDAGRRLRATEVAMLGLQLASVLAYLHHHRWLHLDLKPANIVATEGLARLIDLSIVRRPGRARAGTGTFEYLSPEQARGGELTTAADVWGLGAVLYTALTARPPYGYDGATDDLDLGDDATSELAGDRPTAFGTEQDTAPDGPIDYPQLNGDPPPLRRYRRVPSTLGAVVTACLRHEPSARPSLTEVSDVLDGWLVAQTGQGARA